MALKQKFIRTKMSLMLAAFTVTAPFSIFAVNESDEKLGKQHLEKAYEYFAEGKLPLALNELDFSKESGASSEALVLKVQLEYMMKDKVKLNDTLNELKKSYPKDINGYILTALLLSHEQKDGSDILKNIETALKLSATDEELDNILSMVEQEDTFEYFRTVCRKQYQVLVPEISKLNSETFSDELSLNQENKAKWQAKPLGPWLWLDNDDCKNLHDSTYVANKILKFVPRPYKTMLKTTLKVSDKRIQKANKGKGVILKWTWINAGSATFWITSR